MALPEAIIINGLPGTGSTTVARLLERRTGYRHVYGGGLFRQMAAVAGQPLGEFMAGLAEDPALERSVDEQLVAEVLAGGVIVESRVIAWLVPDGTPDFSVWLTCDLAERTRRVTEREASPDAERQMLEREKIDADRYRNLYGIDLADHAAYDLVIDTTKIPAETVAERILEKIS